VVLGVILVDKLRKRLEYVLKHNRVVQRVYRIALSSFFRFLGLFVNTDENLVLFASFSGKAYNDSPREIYEHMLQRPDCKNLKYVWAFEDPDKFDFIAAEKVKIDTMRYFITALRAKYWVTSVNVERGLKFKKRGTIYLNTWHGIPLKTVGNAVPGRSDFDFSNVDIFCYSGEYEREIYVRDFKVSEESLLLSGMPRNDRLYRVTSDEVRILREKLNIPADKKVILYAPTWRDSTDGGRTYMLAPPIEVSKWRAALEDEFVLLLRTHVATNKLLGVVFDDFVRDVTDYPDINDLLAIADVLISDYSAVIFDYSILSKPIICFGYDYEEYCRKRGLYVDLNNEIPGGVLYTEDEVLERLLNMDYVAESENSKAFAERYIQVTGNATEMCVNNLLKKGGLPER
jgi:CDP-glycerol glycerophosphotransferase